MIVETGGFDSKCTRRRPCDELLYVAGSISTNNNSKYRKGFTLKNNKGIELMYSMGSEISLHRMKYCPCCGTKFEETVK